MCKQNKVKTRGKHNTRSGQYNDLSNRRQSTIVQRNGKSIGHTNLCENMDDIIKNEQCDFTEKCIKKLFSTRVNREKQHTVSLDTHAHRTIIMLQKLAFWKNTLVEKDSTTAKKHSDAGFHCYEGKLNDYVKSKDEKSGVIIADSESSTTTMLTFFHDLLANDLCADKCILFLNASTRDSDGLTMLKYIAKIKCIIAKFKRYDIEILKEKKYSCHRDNKITRGAPMYAFWLSIVKK